MYRAAASSRYRARKDKEEKRPPHGLVKILSLPYEGRVQERHDRRLDTVLCFETLLGALDSMYVWFPAAWVPLVVDAIRAKNVWWDRVGSQQGTVAFADPQEAPLPETRELQFKYKRWPMDEEGHSPILDVRANVDWLTLDTRTFYHFLSRLYNGILNDVFTQKASMGWHPASPARVVVSLLLPGSLEVENWLLLARQKRNMWPLQMTMHTVGCTLPTELLMRRERRRLKAKHLWAGLAPQWDKLRARLFTQKVPHLSRDHLYERLFLLKFGTQQRFREAEYRGHDYWEVHGKWKQTQEWYRKAADAQSPSLLALADYFIQFEYADATSWEWIRWQEKSVAQVWHTKYGVYRRKERQMYGMTQCRCGNEEVSYYAAGPKFSLIAMKGFSCLPDCSWSTLVLSAPFAWRC